MAKRKPRFVSKKQWGWAFANKKPWARRQARRTKRPYKSLPGNK